jgi:hypothetical protein
MSNYLKPLFNYLDICKNDPKLLKDGCNKLYKHIDKYKKEYERLIKILSTKLNNKTILIDIVSSLSINYLYKKDVFSILYDIIDSKFEELEYNTYLNLKYMLNKSIIFQDYRKIILKQLSNDIYINNRNFLYLIENIFNIKYTIEYLLNKYRIKNTKFVKYYSTDVDNKKISLKYKTTDYVSNVNRINIFRKYLDKLNIEYKYNEKNDWEKILIKNKLKYYTNDYQLIRVDVDKQYLRIIVFMSDLSAPIRIEDLYKIYNWYNVCFSII